MYLVTLPSVNLLVSPDQLPGLLATIAETRYVLPTGEILQTTSEHELLGDAKVISLLVQQGEPQPVRQRK